MSSNVVAIPYKQEVGGGQSAIAEAFVAEHRDKYMFTSGIGWHEYTGRKWDSGDDGDVDLRVEHAVVETARKLLADRRTDKDHIKAASDVLLRDSAVKGVVGYLKRHPQLRVGATKLNPDPMLLNVGNGTLNLTTGVLGNHNPGDRITMLAGADYSNDARGPRWEKFLAESLATKGLIDAAGRCFGGVGLPGNVREHLLPVLYGPTGSGKGTFINAASQAFGDYAIAGEPDMLMPVRGTHPTGLTDLHGARLAYVSESEEGRRMATATMKRLTGGDNIRARRMGGNFFEFEPSHLLVLLTNHLPVMPSGDDPAVWRRVHVIPFDNPPTKPDLALPDLLKDELSAVLTWLVSGRQRYVESGMDIAWPEEVKAATKSYRDKSDLIGQFLNEATEVATAMESVPVGELYSMWKTWLDNNAPDVKPGRTQDFRQQLSDHGEDVESVKGGGGRSAIRGRRRSR